MKHIPGLNGLRAFAVLNVIIFHWGLPPFTGSKTVEKLIPNANFGVNVFFVLSGFLITTILLLEKNRIDLEKRTVKQAFFRFYLRRSLRIFPIYYLTLLLLSFSDLPDFHKNLPYYLSYTENFNVLIQNHWDSFTHTWSLSVEEQFYLLWPFVILYTRKALLVPLMLLFIGIGPLFSIFQTYVLQPPLNAFILTPSCFDAFGLGAVIAYYYAENNLRTFQRWIKILLPFSILLFFYWMFAPMGGHFQYFKRFFQSIIACAMILFCLHPSYTTLRNRVLGNKIMNWLGVVSYGLYLYHYALPWFYGKAKERFPESLGRISPFLDYILMLALLIGITALSYYYIERPILRQKDRFN